MAGQMQGHTSNQPHATEYTLQGTRTARQDKTGGQIRPPRSLVAPSVTGC